MEKPQQLQKKKSPRLRAKRKAYPKGWDHKLKRKLTVQEYTKRHFKQYGRPPRISRATPAVRRTRTLNKFHHFLENNFNVDGNDCGGFQFVEEMHSLSGYSHNMNEFLIKLTKYVIFKLGWLFLVLAIIVIFLILSK